MHYGDTMGPNELASVYAYYGKILELADESWEINVDDL